MSDTPKHPLADLADEIVAHINSDASSDTPLWDRHYDPSFVSVEADGMTHSGRDEVQKKHDEWFANHTVHSVKAERAFLGHNRFGILIALDAEAKDGSWPRMQMQELGVYSVEGGKIVREEFMMPPMC